MVAKLRGVGASVKIYIMPILEIYSFYNVVDVVGNKFVHFIPIAFILKV
jgi:hypothetical protein